ncbi:MAG: TonB-dependent receptor [Aquisalinus sp.]|nr:TonB-dependent receptor [Aquisalinus sp.]
MKQSTQKLITRAGLLATASVAALGLSTAHAQDGGLDTIIVTAQKRAEDIKDVPVSVGTVSGEELDVLQSAGVDVRFLSARVPSLQIESSFGRTFPRFYIRGLGNTDFDLNASQPVSFVYDDIVLENPVLKGLPLFDIDQVEVLRGPQGTLFGRNTPAGVVKVASAKPTDEFEAFASASWARFNTIGTEAMINGPINDDWSMRLSGTYLHRDDWVDNLASGPEDELGGYDDFGWRAQLLYDNDGPLTALFNVHGWGSDGTARLFRANIIQPGTDNLTQDFNRDEVFYDGVNKQKVRGYGATMTLDYDLGDHTLTSVTGWKDVEVFSRGDIDGGFGAAFIGNDVPPTIPFPAESADGLPEHEQITQEIRLSSNDLGAFDYMVGFFYFDESFEIDTFNFNSLAPGNPQNGYTFQSQDTQAWALFGNADFEATEKLTLQAGLRYSYDEKEFTAGRVQSPIISGPAGALAASTVEADDDFISWNVAATYEVTENQSIFARIATGHRAPAFQGRLLFGDVITQADTEEIISYEGGVKGDFAEGRGSYSLTGFYYEISDQQLTAVGGGANFNQLLNADETIGYGFEFDTRYAPTENIFLTAGLSYNFTEIQDSGLEVLACGQDQCTITDPVRQAANPFAPDGFDEFANIDGNPLPHAPEIIANVTARFSQPLPNGGETFVFTDAAYESDKNFFLYESAEFQSGDLLEVGVRVGYVSPDGDMEIAAFGRNIFNDESLRGGIDFNNLTGFVNEPPVFGFEIKKSYN